MFFLKLRKFKNALASRDFSQIAELAQDLAGLVGFDQECKELIGLITACKNGDYTAALEEASMFLHDVAKMLGGFKTSKSTNITLVDSTSSFLEAAENNNLDDHVIKTTKVKVFDPITAGLITQAIIQVSQWIVQTIITRRNAK